MRDIAVQLTHYPGELARVAAVLSQHRVNLTSLTGLAIGPHVTIRLIPDDIDAARAAFDAAGIRFQENEIVQVLLENRAGELAMISTRLAEGGVNLRAIYVTGRVGNLVELALVPDNVMNAKRLLEYTGLAAFLTAFLQSGYDDDWKFEDTPMKPFRD
jgi:hypothetical protein